MNWIRFVFICSWYKLFLVIYNYRNGIILVYLIMNWFGCLENKRWSFDEIRYFFCFFRNEVVFFLVFIMYCFLFFVVLCGIFEML